jgi:hypothetical protein
VRLITRGGHDWTKRFPWVAEASLRNRRKQFVVDGEAVVLGVDGIADFNALHSGKQNGEVQFCAFDVLAVDGEDVRDLPLSMRKVNLDFSGPAGWHLHQPVRDRRHRTGSLSRGLRYGIGRLGVQARRSALPGRKVSALGESEEP